MPGIGIHSRAWSSTILSPAGGDNAHDLDTLIQNITRDIGQRFDEEHELNVGVGGGGAAPGTVGDGEHKHGSAVIGYDTLANRIGSVTSVGLNRGPLGNNKGRIYRASNTGQLFVSDGVADWHEAVTGMAGNASNRLDLLSNVQWLKAGADAMDIHAHKVRHLSAVSGVGAGDRIPLLIESITQGSAAPSPPASTTNYATVTRDFSTRSGNSTVLLLGTVQLDDIDSGTGLATFQLYYGGSGIGDINAIALTGAARVAAGCTMIGVVTNVTNAAGQAFHVRCITFTNTSGFGNVVATIRLTVIDLGRT